jgi:hypothetical protein
VATPGEIEPIADISDGQQIKLYATRVSVTSTTVTLAWHAAGNNLAQRGTITIDRTGPPYAITGSLTTVAPTGILVENAVFLLAVGDEVITTDGVHYVVQVLGSDVEGAQLPDGVWSPSDALTPQFRMEDIAQNLGPA